MARRRNWGNYWAYDGQSTLYGARELLPDTREGETVIITVKRQARRAVTASPLGSSDVDGIHLPALCLRMATSTNPPLNAAVPS